jgi:hypothetical protein
MSDMHDSVVSDLIPRNHFRSRQPTTRSLSKHVILESRTLEPARNIATDHSLIRA